MAPILIVAPAPLTTRVPDSNPPGVKLELAIEFVSCTVGVLATVLLPTVMFPPTMFIVGMRVLPTILSPDVSRDTLAPTSTLEDMVIKVPTVTAVLNTPRGAWTFAVALMTPVTLTLPTALTWPVIWFVTMRFAVVRFAETV